MLNKDDLAAYLLVLGYGPITSQLPYRNYNIIGCLPRVYNAIEALAYKIPNAQLIARAIKDRERFNSIVYPTAHESEYLVKLTEELSKALFQIYICFPEDAMSFVPSKMIKDEVKTEPKSEVKTSESKPTIVWPKLLD